jgi:hypothetical protein
LNVIGQRHGAIDPHRDHILISPCKPPRPRPKARETPYLRPELERRTRMRGGKLVTRLAVAESGYGQRNRMFAHRGNEASYEFAPLTGSFALA